MAREPGHRFNSIERFTIECGTKTMIDQLQQFHFLRPLWLLSLLPAAALAFALWRMPSSGANWRRTIAADLLEHLLDAHLEQRKRWPWLVLLVWIIAALALAGPTWEKLPQPVLQKRDALVVVLDLSLSMYAEDIKPSRLQRARFKIIDILRRRDEGLTGLVAYSGDAHVVSPLTDDTATIANLVPALAPDMMPSYGSDPVAGIEQAIKLLRNAGFERGRIFLLSDEITEANIEAITKLIDGGWQLSVLGIGTEQGAPIPLTSDGKSNGFLKQRNGEIVVAQLHRQRFTQLAQRSGSRYSDLRADDKDLDALLPLGQIGDETRAVQREFDQWRERGTWLAILLLPFAALVFRRGWLLALLILPLSPPAPAQTPPSPQQPPSTLEQQQARSAEPPQTDWRKNLHEQWRDLWQRPDQQAQQAMNAGDVKAAAERFRDPAWRGAALYRAGDYAAAAQTLQNVDGADADYNRGNALARAGQLPEALAAYDAALKKNPNLDDAKTNRKLVEKLLQQQQQNDPADKNKDNKEKKSDQNNEQNSQQQSGDNNQQSDDADEKQSQNENPQNKNPADGDANNQGDAQNNTDAHGKQPPPPTATTDAESAADKKSADPQAAQQQSAEAAKDNTRDQQQNAVDAKQAEENEAQSEQQQESQQQTQQQIQQQRATDQWLRQIPDDPAGLLRRKFLYEHRQRERAPDTRDDEQPLW